MSTEVVSNYDNSLTLRTEVNLSEDDLSEQAKKQFSIHTEILHTHQMNARCTLADKQLSPIGRHLLSLIFEQSYTNCKNVLNYVAAHPEITATTNLIRAPIIICGLPRTGTTLLYNLLACDSACRAPLFTDMMEPVPPLSRSDTTGQLGRQKIVNASNDIFNAVGLINYEREISACHPSFAYEEDEYILQHAGINLFPYMLAPDKDSELVMWYLNDTNKDFAYEYHKIFIQMLNSVDAPETHWLLKAPIHTLFLDTLLHHYPNASLITVHRKLDEVFPSIVRLVTAYTRAFFDNDKANVATNNNTALESAVRIVDATIRRLVKFRLTNQTTPVLDVLYDDLLTQPIDTIRRIYEYFKLTWTEDFELAMLAWLRDNPQGKHGRNTYTLEEFGMKHEIIEKCYEEYNNLFLKTQNQSSKDSDVTKESSVDRH